MKIRSAVAIVSILVTGVALAESHTDKSVTKAAGASMTAAKGAGLQSKLEAMERKAWEAFKAQDFKTFKGLMAAEMRSADVNGFATLAQFEPTMKDYVVESYDLSDWKVLSIDKDAAVLTYTANVNAKYKGQAVPSGPYYVSSTWALRGGKWVGLFHQETLAASAMSTATSTTDK